LGPAVGAAVEPLTVGVEEGVTTVAGWVTGVTVTSSLVGDVGSEVAVVTGPVVDCTTGDTGALVNEAELELGLVTEVVAVLA
jgi:hypothetical protein